jgi:DNA modification methylase
VLDPFFGAGTTGLVAQKHGRRCVGIELNPEYVEIAKARLGLSRITTDNEGVFD